MVEKRKFCEILSEIAGERYRRTLTRGKEKEKAQRAEVEEREAGGRGKELRSCWGKKLQRG